MRISLLALLLSGCAGLTPVGQQANSFRETAIAVWAAEYDAAVIQSHRVICELGTYRGEQRFMQAKNITKGTFNTFCGRDVSR